MYSNMKYYENICNCLRVIQQDINRKLKSANCWQRTSLINSEVWVKRAILSLVMAKDTGSTDANSIALVKNHYLKKKT